MLESNGQNTVWWRVDITVRGRTYQLNHTQLALVLFSQLSVAVVRHKANDDVVYAIRAWFKYDTVLSAVV